MRNSKWKCRNILMFIEKWNEKNCTEVLGDTN